MNVVSIKKCLSSLNKGDYIEIYTSNSGQWLVAARNGTSPIHNRTTYEVISRDGNSISVGSEKCVKYNIPTIINGKALFIIKTDLNTLSLCILKIIKHRR